MKPRTGITAFREPFSTSELAMVQTMYTTPVPTVPIRNIVLGVSGADGRDCYCDEEAPPGVAEDDDLDGPVVDDADGLRTCPVYNPNNAFPLHCGRRPITAAMMNHSFIGGSRRTYPQMPCRNPKSIVLSMQQRPR